MTNPPLYYSYSSYLKAMFNQRVQKISIDAGFSCPNRDGKVGRNGCTYCNNDAFTPHRASRNISVQEQIRNVIPFLKKRYKAQKFIAYFQPYSNTYASTEYLRKVYFEALSVDDIIGISIGTRPDCVNDEILDLIADISEKTHLWIEYGLQSIHNATLKLINRGHDLDAFLWTFEETRKFRKINICVHIIHGLPGEDENMMLDTVKLLSDLKIDGIKFHQLHIVRDTQIEKDYLAGKINLISFEDYMSILGKSLDILSPEIVVQRLFGTGSPETVVAPEWAKMRGSLTHKIEKYLIENNHYQGKLYPGTAKDK